MKETAAGSENGRVPRVGSLSATAHRYYPCNRGIWPTNFRAANSSSMKAATALRATLRLPSVSAPMGTATAFPFVGLSTSCTAGT